MKTFFSFLLLIPFLSFEQQGTSVYGFEGMKKDSICKPVSLPDLQSADLSEMYDLGKNSFYDYIVSHDSVYYRIFSRYAKNSLPVYDFSKQELLVHISCRYCAGSGSYNNEPRHRNACQYKAFWCLRNKKEGH
ncbi:MAG: hypothetical protein WDO16_24050 [Bacteroidota bacterium]